MYFLIEKEKERQRREEEVHVIKKQMLESLSKEQTLQSKLMDELNQLRSERKQREFQNYELDKQMLRQITEHRATSHAKLHE